MEMEFVVTYDTDRKTFFVDHETAKAVFPDGLVFDEDSWRLDTPDDRYDHLADRLGDLLDNYEPDAVSS